MRSVNHVPFTSLSVFSAFCRFIIIIPVFDNVTRNMFSKPIEKKCNSVLFISVLVVQPRAIFILLLVESIQLILMIIITVVVTEVVFSFKKTFKCLTCSLIIGLTDDVATCECLTLIFL